MKDIEHRYKNESREQIKPFINFFVESFMNELNDYLNGDILESKYFNRSKYDDGKILHKILLSNECKLDENTESYIEKIPHNGFGYIYNIDIVYYINAYGNDANEYYDLVNYNGYYTLIIFLDYFKDMANPDDEYKILGRAMHLNAIENLIEMVISLQYNPASYGSQLFSLCSSARYMRTIPLLAASYIVDRIFGLEEIDVEGCVLNYEEIRDLLDNISIKDILAGILVY